MTWRLTVKEDGAIVVEETLPDRKAALTRQRFWAGKNRNDLHLFQRRHNQTPTWRRSTHIEKIAPDPDD